MELYHRRPGEHLLEFGISLLESADTDVWQIDARDPMRAVTRTLYVETVVEPDPRDLIDKILSAYYTELEEG